MIRSKAVDRPPSEWSARWGSGSLMLCDAAIAAWLWHAVLRFTGKPDSVWPGILGPIFAIPILARAFGLNGFRPRGRAVLLVRTLFFGAAVAALGAFAASRGWLPISEGQILWLGGAVAGLVWLTRAVYFAAGLTPAEQPWEPLRWFGVGITGTLVMLPFYHGGGLGSGDAHWYAVMLTDFLEQLRSSVFPVWVGQSVDAFNGAVSPLRFAPGFQYFGGLIDLLTVHALDPIAVRNASVAVASLLGAYSAYACLRALAAQKPWVAFGLAVLWICGPGVWAPAFVGDQYMTLMATPFVPIVLYGSWRVWDVNDGWARFWIASGLAGCWLCHPPVALWMTLIAAGIYLSAAFRRREWSRELGLSAFMAAIFLILGSVPFISVLTLDDTLKSVASGAYAAEMVHTYFPANFLPINPRITDLSDYQLGYSLLAALGASLLLLFKRRPRAAWAFALALLVIVPFTVPIPWLTTALWTHVPVWFVTVENVWPMQRLFLVATSLVAFLAAIMLGPPEAVSATWKRAALVVAFLCGTVWSAHEAHKVIPALSRITPAETRMSYSPENILLTRYAYSSFEYAPAYFSHSYMEPWFENRLLDWHTLEPTVTNADAAAPVQAAGPAAADPRLVQSGLLTAKQIPGSSFYRLLPQMVLNPGKHYALRLDFTEPERPGTLQLMHPSLFREYQMPDSGAGINRADQFVLSRAFGSDATNSHVIPLTVSGTGPFAILAMFIADKSSGESYPYAKYWLYTYERSQLPIAVESWIPYRAKLKADAAAYLETPRMWLKGWKATVNGHATPTLRSPENLVMVPIAAGESRVALDYHPPPLLSAAFWVSAAGWLGMGALSLCRLAFFSGGSATRREKAEGSGAAAPGRPARVRTAGPKVILAACVVLAIAAAFVLVRRRNAHRPTDLGGAGPIRIEFTRPYRQIGLTQPLLSTGHPNAGTIVFITFLDSRHVRIGADVWGSLFKSEPIEMDYNQVQSLVVSDSALFPLDDAKVKELAPRELARLRGELRVELNGKTVIVAACNAYETQPSEILVGESRFGSVSDNKFLGEILHAGRLPIPRAIALPTGWHAHARLRFPEGRVGATEPLLTATAGSASQRWSVTYLDHHSLRFESKTEKGTQQSEWGYDPAKIIDLDFESSSVGALSAGSGDPHAISLDRSLSGPPPVLVSGFDATALGPPGLEPRFTGPQLDLTMMRDTPETGDSHADLGREHMIVRLPSGKPGRGEPLLVTGVTGKGDFIYVTYEDETHIRIGYDHWGYGGSKSDSLALDYGIPHELWISLGSLFPDPDDSTFWGRLSPEEKLRLTSHVSVVLDGRSVLSSSASPYPSGPNHVTVAKNTIGGSSCDAVFTGTVEFAEREGAGGPSSPSK
jgi:hypothetical protein